MSTAASRGLLLKRHSLAEWRHLAATSHKPQYQRLLRQADSHHAQLPPAEHPSDSITYIGTAALNLGLAYLLSGDSAYLDTAREWIKVAIAYPHWGKERMPDHDLDAAWLLFGLGLAYDWLKHSLPDQERGALRDKLAWQGRQLYDFALASEGSWWSSAYWQNHNWICYGGLAAAAYALQDELEAAGSWAGRARDNFVQALAYMPEDGSNYEGPVYWRYGFIWFLIYADLLRQETGEDLHDCGFLRHAFFYRLYLSGPNLIDTANFGDCHDRRSAHSAAVYARLAHLYDIGEAQWLYQHFYRSCEWQREGQEGLVKPGLWAESGLEFLWYDPLVAETRLDDLPLQRLFPDLGLLSMRSGWQPDAAMLAFKCGPPNGAKAWHSGHALNEARGWHTLNPGHDHPDANSFILIQGDDYIAVDDGYAKSKLSANHSTLLVDGRGQYAEGSYNAFRDLDESWGARLEATLASGDLLYARGEAARAYDPSLRLRQFTRETLFLAGEAVVIRDTVSSDRAHDYAWLLQSDAPALPVGDSQFRLRAGASLCHIHALLPSDIRHSMSEREITANPTSAKPDWIIRRQQHTLSLSPPGKVADCRFLTALDLAEQEVTALPASRGDCASLSKGQREWRVGFARGRDGIQAEGLNVDGAYFAGCWEGGALARYLAGDVSAIWLDGQLQLICDCPLDIAWTRRAGELHIEAASKSASWLRFRSPTPLELRCAGQAVDSKHDAATGMVWLRLESGRSTLSAAMPPDARQSRQRP